MSDPAAKWFVHYTVLTPIGPKLPPRSQTLVAGPYTEDQALQARRIQARGELVTAAWLSPDGAAQPQVVPVSSYRRTGS